MTRRRLPIGIQTFREIREDGCYYVDKTAHVRRLLDEGKHFFLSRPRRFGKSLFLDTLKELFEGNEPLFEGLVIHDSWDWSVRHPVLRLSFGAGHFKEPGYLHTDLMAAELDAVERGDHVSSEYPTGPERFGHLLEALHGQAGRPRRGAGRRVRQADSGCAGGAGGRPRQPRLPARSLRGHQGQRCAHPVQLHHRGEQVLQGEPVLGLNNLMDITLDPRYSAICGYTDADLDTVFAPELPGLDRKAIRDWYNGYGWLGEEKVYNPFDILLLFDKRKFGAWWFETGTPAFLVETLFRRRVSSLALDELVGSADLLSTFDVDDIATEALLFQTGYLTIRDEEDLGGEPCIGWATPTGKCARA